VPKREPQIQLILDIQWKEPGHEGLKRKEQEEPDTLIILLCITREK
jgi:hypothetical protein